MRHIKLKAQNLSIDPKYQREVDSRRVAAMSRKIEFDCIGVPVVSQRADGQFYVLDGQHRVGALVESGNGARDILCEVHTGLSVRDESELFLRLNGGRKAVRVFDKWKARLIASEPVAMEMHAIITRLGLKVTKAPAKRSICAIQKIERVHKTMHNLEQTLTVLREWDLDDSSVFDGDLVDALAHFIATYDGAVDVAELARRLRVRAPGVMINSITRLVQKPEVSFRDAACRVFREAYNKNRIKADRLPHPNELAA